MAELSYPTGTGIDCEAATLIDLWHRRSHLSTMEMGRIYTVVRGALHGYYPSELRALPEDKDELIAQFIFSRVLRLDTDDYAEPHECPDSAPSNAYAICAYFRHYLIDCLRSASHRRNISIEVDGVSAELDAHAHPLDDPVESVLAEYGLNERQTRQAARAFVNSLDDGDRIILAASLGTCCDTNGGLRGIAHRHRLASYHYHARKLGVTLKKTAHSDDYGSTKIGSWIRDTLGIEIVAENRPVILIILNLLAVDAHE
ncbi:hypothetical protein [Paraburkholderia rhizosphaerae]|uniref:Uncharacterized protein n=1 Tax=Paraburkholderia rhizosphaerae TaxID=480658 RepID=A0A4R8LEH5_9BURK|nr:hypothetical protein [Paraburkholderia rhizosphaerae]TDY40549.1 hypothetical protein BX592_12462 [Paraburkholderia rhizosphaerae]